MADAAGSAVAGPKKAKARGAAASSEPVGFHARVVDRLNAYEEPAPAKGKAKAKDEHGSTSSSARSTATRTSTAAITGDAPEVQLKAQSEAAASPARRLPQAVTVEGFRGIGKPATLDLPPGPGLTLVIGRNGSGKSSFAEALELLLTGDTFRWKDKSTKVWKEGWRNLHHPTAAHRGRVRRRRREGARHRQAPMGGRAPASRASRPACRSRASRRRTSTRSAGRRRSSAYRPFLSYNELGSMLEEGPSHLYDALASILGLDELVAAQDAAGRGAQDPREGAQGSGARCATSILRNLPQVEDDRARVLLDALGRDDWGLDDAEAVVSHADDDRAGGPRARRSCRQLASLAVRRTRPQVDSAIRALRDAAAGAEERPRARWPRDRRTWPRSSTRPCASTSSHGDGACPVCGKKAALDAAWHEHQAKEVKRLRDAAREATHGPAPRPTRARRAHRAARRRAPRPSGRRPTVGLDGGDVLRHLDDWQKALDATGPRRARRRPSRRPPAPLRAAVADLRAKAAAEVQRREDAWRPLALADRTPGCRSPASARDGADAIKPLKAAEAWLKDAVADLRNEQFAPIKEKCQAIWTQLRQQSNVALEDIRLAGTATQRKVELDVTVDGVEGAALGVMSQGELHALALSACSSRARRWPRARSASSSSTIPSSRWTPRAWTAWPACSRPRRATARWSSSPTTTACPRPCAGWASTPPSWR